MSLFVKYKLHVMRRSRSRKLDHFYSICDPDSSVLDVGISNTEYNDQTNVFLRNFRFNSDQYTGLAVDPMDVIRKKYPDKRIVEYPGGVFPFRNNEFDWVFSNAVIEHVGSKGDQLLFLNEMLRVANNVLFTTPNKYFPVDSHTGAYFRHWSNDGFYAWCKKNRSNWSIDNLLLLGLGDLVSLVERSNSKKYKIHKNRLFGWPMTFTVICSAENG